MKLVMDLNPVNFSYLKVFNGDEQIAEYMSSAMELTDMIDVAFAERYIEAVYVNQPCNNFNKKFVDYIESNYRNVEVYYND